ncbi:MAG: histone deacetylase family protein [Chloroflexota bacterium]
MHTPILTFYTPHHSGHAPRIEQLHGRNVPYFETPRRVDVLRDALYDANLIDIREPQERISVETLSRTHSRAMINHLKYLSEHVDELVREDFAVYGMEHVMTGDEYYYESIFPTQMMRRAAVSELSKNQRGFFIFDNTGPVGPGTWGAIVYSATLAYEGARALLSGEDRVYAMCRPPGHHAGRTFAGGYCFFNNAGVAANVLRSRGKVAILDIDYHHGNGTQAIFWDDPGVLYVSIHADPAVDYPYYAGFADETGGEAAEGLTINYPLPHGTDEADYLLTLNRALDDIRQYEPAALIVSLGFDTIEGDPMARFRLNVDSYARLGALVAGLGLPTLYVQEGGYFVDKLGDMAVSFFNGVVGG